MHLLSHDFDSREAVRALPTVDQASLANKPVAVSMEMPQKILASAPTRERLTKIMSLTRPGVAFDIQDPSIRSSIQ